MQSTELHVCVTGQQFSIRPAGTDPSSRTAIFQGMRYGDGPDAVIITYGIQGEGYLRGVSEHWDTITKDCKAIMGYVFKRHVPIYKRILKGRARVEVLMTGRPYGDAGPEMDWLVVWVSRATPTQRQGR